MRLLFAAGCVLVLFACGSNRSSSGVDAAASDVATADVPAVDASGDSALTDAPADVPSTDAPLTDVGRTMCTFNWDCGETELCVSSEGESFCEAGARGETPYDAACTTSEECVSGGCIDAMFCTKQCENSAGCDGANLTRCNPVVGICVLP